MSRANLLPKVVVSPEPITSPALWRLTRHTVGGVGQIVALTSTLASAVVPPLEPIGRGQLAVALGWLTPDLVARLRGDAISLRAAGAFQSSGLSNTAKGDKARQGFGASDRSVCAITPQLGGDREARAEFAHHLDAVREALQADGRPGLVCAEQCICASDLILR